MRRLINVCGLPGSGKSTFALWLAQESGGIAVAADDFFYEKGAYCAIGGAARALGIPDESISRGLVGKKLGMSDADIIGRVITANDTSKTKTEMLRKVKDICK